jgi:hypothetical protein
VHGQLEDLAQFLLYAQQSRHGVPVVAVHDIEPAEDLLHRPEAIDEGVAHQIHLGDDISG